MTNSFVLIFATMFGADAPAPILAEAPAPIASQEMVLPATLAFVSATERTCYNCQRPITSGVRYWAETPFCSGECIDAIQGYGPPVPPYTRQESEAPKVQESEAPCPCSCPDCKCSKGVWVNADVPADFTVSVEPTNCANGQCSVVSKVKPNGTEVTKTVCSGGNCGVATILGQPTGWMQLSSCSTGNCGTQVSGTSTYSTGSCGSSKTFRPGVAARKVAFAPARLVGKILFGRRK